MQGTSPTSSVNGRAEYVPPRVASGILGVSIQSLRSWEAQGKITAYRTPGGFGKRRYKIDELKAQLGFEEPKVLKGKVGVYCRVSSQSQEKNGERQLERLLQVVHEREGIPKSEILIFKDTASSYSNREGLNKLMQCLRESFGR